MEQTNKYQRIIQQVNIHSEDRSLFTTSIGEETGVKTRSICFCFDRLWAWWKGVSYDKHSVANAISESFNGLDFSNLQGVPKQELKNFYTNLRSLRDTFRKDKSFNNPKLNGLIQKLGNEVFSGQGSSLIGQKPPWRLSSQKQYGMSRKRRESKEESFIRRPNFIPQFQSRPLLGGGIIQKIQSLDDEAQRELFSRKILALPEAGFQDTFEDIPQVTELLGLVYAQEGSSEQLIGNEVQVARFERLFSAIDRHLVGDIEEDLSVLPRRIEPIYPDLSKEEVSIKIKTLDFEAFNRDLNLLEQASYRGDLEQDKGQILNLIFQNSEEEVRKTYIGGSDYRAFKRLFDGIGYMKEDIRLNPHIWRGGDIIEKPQTIQDYVQEQFGLTEVSRKQKSAERAMHFAESGYSMQTSRGDGNCLTNSLAAGLMHVIKKEPLYRATLIGKLRQFQQCEDPYVLLDMGPTAPLYSQNFKKEEDFAKVLKALEEGQEALDNPTMAAFSRVLRYILTLEQFKTLYIEGTSNRVGVELGFANIHTFNQVFELNARVLVLEAKPVPHLGIEYLNEQDSEDPSVIFRASGADPTVYLDLEDREVTPTHIKIEQLLREEPNESFNVIRTDGHFNLMVK